MFPVNDIDYVVRMESFSTDITEVLNTKLGLNCTVVHSGAIEHENYNSFYTDHLRERVRQLYTNDITYGEYRF
jgi:hypothetical protein